MKNIFVLVTILGHLPVILFAKRKGSEDMKQILIVEDDSIGQVIITKAYIEGNGGPKILLRGQEVPLIGGAQ